MILSRVIEHVRLQNWTAIAIDFVIVVAGVFIGIQVANLNNDVAQKRLGRDYAARLHRDLQGDIVNTQMQADYYATVLENIKETERLLTLPGPDPRALLVAAYRASEISSNPANRATWDQIVSSGHLEILPAVPLESGLADYYRFVEANLVADNLLQTTPYRRTLRSVVPLPVQLAMREGCSDATDEINVITGFVAECRLNIDDEALEEIAAALLSSPSLKADLRFQHSLVYTVQNNETGSLVLLKRLLAAFEEEGWN
jgi:hypothetical protein